MRLTAFLLAALLLAGCERPLVDTIAPAIEVSGADLSAVQTADALPLSFRVADATGLTIGPVAAAFDAGAQTFRATLELRRGLNRFVVQATDGAGVIATDTLRVVRLDLESPQALAFGLPTPRTEAAAAAVQGRVLVTGGAGPDRTALASMTVLTPAGLRYTGTDRPLLARRAGHTASVLPGGSVLLVGGASVETPQRPDDFVATVEVVRPGADASEAVLLPDGAPRRAGHTARVLRTDGRTLLYLYGGLVPEGSGAAPSGTVDIFEWDGEALRRLSPEGGAGQFAAQAGHVQLPLAGGNGGSRRTDDLVVGPVASLRFVYTAPGTQYPFDVDALAAPGGGLADAVAAPMALDGFGLVAGGRSAEGTLAGTPTVYVLDGGTLVPFQTAAVARLLVPRTGAAATLLPDGRILVAGGRDAGGSVSAAAEIYSY